MEQELFPTLRVWWISGVFVGQIVPDSVPGFEGLAEWAR